MRLSTPTVGPHGHSHQPAQSGEVVTVPAFGLTRETLLDLTVNAIPLGILLFLDALFWLVNPFGWDLWYVFWMHALTLFPFGVLLLVTYVSGRVVQRDEGKLSDSEH